MRGLSSLLFAVVVGCGSNAPKETDAGGSGASSSGFGGSSSSSGSGGLVGVGCADGTQLVYVMTDSGELHSFDPEKKVFTKKGTIQCSTGGTPNSMAVDRQGIGWVNYSNGKIFKVRISDAQCEPTTFVPQAGFAKFGMAFASDTDGGSDETLFVAGLSPTGLPASGGAGLAKIDLATMKLTTLGDYSSPLSGRDAELTGTGEGKLFGFFTTSPATLAEIAKTNAATTSPASLDGVNTGFAFAFSFWGGDFYFYTAQLLESSAVQRYRPSTRSVEEIIADVGFRIVGAGVSTCAPTMPPK